MVDSISSSNIPTSVQAVNRAQASRNDDKKTERSESSNPQDEVTLSVEAQDLTDVNRAALETRNILQENQDQVLTSAGQRLNQLL